MVLTKGPRWGTVVTRPSASSSRSASRMDGRLTPVISQSSRSTRRWPGFSFPDMMASRNFCATLERTVGTSSIRSDCSSARLSIVYRLNAGIGSIAIYRQNHHLHNLTTAFRLDASTIVDLLNGTADDAHAMDQPPSIGSVAPVISCAAGLHRKAAIAPTPSMATNRPVGCRLER